MAEAYDVLAGLNRMLESQERREQTRLQTSLAMMQFAQQKRMQDIQVAGQQLQVLQTANEQMVSGLANDFLQRSGLEALYSQFGGDTEDGFKNAVDELTSKVGKGDIGLGLDLDTAEASKIASAVWAAKAKNPEAMLELASSIKRVNESVTTGVKPPDSDIRLAVAFKRLGYFDNPDWQPGLPMGATATRQIGGISKTLQNRQDIIAEMLEFGKGEYDIQRDIGTYEGLRKPTADYLKATNFLTAEQSMKQMMKVIESSKKDEGWDPSASTSLILAGGIYASQYADPAIRSEIVKYSKGADDYLKQLARDLKRYRPKNPDKGGLPFKEFKDKYNVRKDNVNVRDKSTMRKLFKSAQRAGLKSTTSIGKALEAVEWFNKSKFLAKTGQIIKGTAKHGAYFAPWAGREIGEAIGGEGGEVAGQITGTTVLAVKAVGKMGFWKFLGKKIPGIAAKAGTIAMMDSPVSPVADFLALGLTISEVINAYKMWQEYKKEPEDPFRGVSFE